MRSRAGTTAMSPDVREIAAPVVAVFSRAPVLGRLVIALDAARYASTLAILTGSGAPLTAGGTFYGYVLARRRADGAIQFEAHDYLNNSVVDSFAVNADGSPAAP